MSFNETPNFTLIDQLINDNNNTNNTSNNSNNSKLCPLECISLFSQQFHNSGPWNKPMPTTRTTTTLEHKVTLDQIQYETGRKQTGTISILFKTKQNRNFLNKTFLKAK